MDIDLSKFNADERYMAFLLSTLNRMQSTSIYPINYDGKYSRSAVLGTALNYAKHREGICLEFGVHSGASLKLSAQRLPNHRFFGFDSFKGFPNDGRPDWNKNFAITPPSNLPKNCDLVEGFFSNTLPEFLHNNTENVAFINIDCDIYSSTATILNELEIAGRIGPGSIIYFDEIINYKTALWNESLALFELLDRTGWGVEWLCIHQNVRGLEESLQLLSTNSYPAWDANANDGYLVQAALRITPKNLDMQALKIPHIAKRIKELALIYKELSNDFTNGCLSDDQPIFPKTGTLKKGRSTSMSIDVEHHSNLEHINQLDLLPPTENLGDPAKRSLNEAKIRARTKSVYLGQNILLCRILGRYKFYVHGEDTGIAPHLLLDGIWEVWITEFIIRNIKIGAKTMDLGANYGYYSILMGSLSGKTGQVLSIEPNPAILPFLERNILVNKLREVVKIDRRAISDESNSDVHFYCPRFEPKNAKMVTAETAERLIKKEGSLVKVRTLALDDLNLTDISFIKVDLEGAEDKFWYGSKKFLSRNPNAIVLLEFNPSRFANAKDVLNDISTMYPLRYLWVDGKVHDTTCEHLINNARGDWMLVLSNHPFY